MIWPKEIKCVLTALAFLVPLFLFSLFMAYYTATAEPTPLSAKSPVDVVLDCDPGVDDVTALLLLLSPASPANLLAVTVVTGNTGAFNGTRNAHLVLRVANQTQIPVYTGSPQGLVFEEESDNFFGYDGLGDIFTDIQAPAPSSKHAASFLAELVKERPGEIVVVATGPLTNIALAIHLNPNFLDEVKQLIIFGGTYLGGGNKKPGVEFNIYCDPEGAAFVFSKVPKGKLITVVPLETVVGMAIPKAWRQDVLGSVDTCPVKFINRIEELKKEQWNPNDESAVLIALEPSLLVEPLQTRVIVETCGRHGRGAFFRDTKSTPEEHNAMIVTSLDQERIKALLLQYLSADFGECIA